MIVYSGRSVLNHATQSRFLACFRYVVPIVGVTVCCKGVTNTPASNPITITHSGHTGKVIELAIEDGSCKCWNVIIIDSDTGHRMPMFVRTVD